MTEGSNGGSVQGYNAQFIVTDDHYVLGVHTSQDANDTHCYTPAITEATKQAGALGKRIGLTLMCHPDNFRESWMHARDYGCLVANPFGRKAMKKGPPSKVVVKPGGRLRLRYAIWIHAGTVDQEPDFSSAYAEYLALSKSK